MREQILKTKSQLVWLCGTLVAAAGIVSVGWVLQPRGDADPVPSLTPAMTIRQIAPRLDTTGKSLAKELRLPGTASLDTPLAELGVTQAPLDEVAAHLWSHRGKQLKYFVFAAIALWALVFLVRLGKPDGAACRERRSWYPRGLYVATLVVAVLTCGFVLGKSPNPMEGAVKVFKAMVGLQSSIPAVVGALVFFLLLAIIGNKLVCGWACPFGALQELVYSLPVLRRLKRKKVPFLVSNVLRGGLFVLMLLILFGWVGGKRGFVLYHPINPFNLFNLEFEGPPMVAMIVASLVLGAAVYRPFCQFVCPFGFVSWLAERVSVYRVRVSPERCNGCGACGVACPTGAARDIVAGRRLAADCYSCARCLTVCPHDALRYCRRLDPADTAPTEIPISDKDPPDERSAPSSAPSSLAGQQLTRQDAGRESV